MPRAATPSRVIAVCRVVIAKLALQGPWPLASTLQILHRSHGLIPLVAPRTACRTRSVAGQCPGQGRPKPTSGRDQPVVVLSSAMKINLGGNGGRSFVAISCRMKKARSRSRRGPADCVPTHSPRAGPVPAHPPNPPALAQDLDGTLQGQARPLVTAAPRGQSTDQPHGGLCVACHVRQSHRRRPVLSHRHGLGDDAGAVRGRSPPPRDHQVGLARRRSRLGSSSSVTICQPIEPSRLHQQIEVAVRP